MESDLSTHFANLTLAPSSLSTRFAHLTLAPSSSPRGFGALPLELLRRIISFTSPRDALRLTRVSRTLHAICKDPLIYKSIIQHQNWVGAREPWWNHLASPLDSTDSLWARYAMADYEAAFFPDTPRPEDPEKDFPSLFSVEEIDRLVTFVPQMIALHRKRPLHLFSKYFKGWGC